MDYSKTSEFMKSLRKDKGLTQEEVADQLMVTPKTISRWECGEGLPDMAIISSVADFYGVTVDELLKGERNIKSEEMGSTETIVQDNGKSRDISDFIPKVSNFYCFPLTVIVLSVCSFLFLLFSAFLVVSIVFSIQQQMNLLVVVLALSMLDALLLAIMLIEIIRLFKLRKIAKGNHSIFDCEIQSIRVRWPFETVIIKVDDKEITISPWLFIRSYSSFLFSSRSSKSYKVLFADKKYYLIRI